MNAVPKVQLTQEGYDEILDELNKLKAKEPQAVERVTRAREMGDLAENSEYHSAREDLAFVQGRIEELEALVARVQLINGSGKKSKVDLGSKVTVKTHDGKTMSFVVVGEYEADPMKQKISIDSPLGKALVGKKEKDSVEFEAPIGKVVYTIHQVN